MIREANPNDAAAITDIWNRVIRETNITFTTEEKTTLQIGEMIANASVFVAQTHKVRGFCTYGPFRSGPGYRFVAEHSIHIAPDAHRRGLGRALMTTLETDAQKHGIDSLIGAMTGDNQRSITFHESCGFHQVGYLPELGVKFGKRHDLVLMQKQLQVSH